MTNKEDDEEEENEDRDDFHILPSYYSAILPSCSGSSSSVLRHSRPPRTFRSKKKPTKSCRWKTTTTRRGLASGYEDDEDDEDDENDEESSSYEDPKGGGASSSVSSSASRTMPPDMSPLTEHCRKRQVFRIDELESENDRLRRMIVMMTSGRSSSAATSYSDSNDERLLLLLEIEEANIQLRRRNFELTQELYDKTMQLEKYESGSRKVEGEGQSLDDPPGDDSLLFKGEAFLQDLKNELLIQRKLLLGSLNGKKVGGAKPLEEEEAAASLSIEARLCPMCEEQFPSDNFSQDDFENHVLYHFDCDANGLVSQEEDMKNKNLFDVFALENGL